MKQILALTAMLLCSGVTAQNDKYTDENRPYKFAFNIEGYQHRSEEKDEKGIVKGEYGFVTGDGVYHVTVYATDENGNFKILSMKNYFIGLPTDGPSQSPSPQTTPPTTTTLKRINTSPGSLRTSPTIRTTAGGIMGCGGCKIPTTTLRPNLNPELEFDIDVRTKDDSFQGIEPPISNVALQYPSTDRTTPKTNIISSRQPLKSYTSTPKNVGSTTTTTTQRIIKSGVNSLKPSSGYTQPASLTTTQKSKILENNGDKLSPNNIRKTLPKQTLEDSKLKTTSKGSDPKSLEKSSSNLLYEFNQTQSFQGQFEQGFVDNSKKGDYFVNDRDGVKRIVEYEANENGFQPHVKFEKITGSDVPFPETEKERNELKGVYFKWFYGS